MRCCEHALLRTLDDETARKIAQKYIEFLYHTLELEPPQGAAHGGRTSKARKACTMAQTNTACPELTSTQISLAFNISNMALYSCARCV